RAEGRRGRGGALFARAAPPLAQAPEVDRHGLLELQPARARELHELAQRELVVRLRYLELEAAGLAGEVPDRHADHEYLGRHARRLPGDLALGVVHVAADVVGVRRRTDRERHGRAGDAHAVGGAAAGAGIPERAGGDADVVVAVAVLWRRRGEVRIGAGVRGRPVELDLPVDR